MNENAKLALEEINHRLDELKKEKNLVEGTETEVYARIVGYYRAVKNWNRGKKEEYRFRNNFKSDSLNPSEKTPDEIPPAAAVVPDQAELNFTPKSESSSYLYFYRKTCPNCPPVRAWLENFNLHGREVDVDNDSGMLEAALFEVVSAPTVIFLNENGKETGRGTTVSALDALVGLSSVAGG